MKKNYRKKKNSFTLLETLICFFIMGILLAVLFQFYTQLTKSKLTVKAKKDSVMANAYFTSNLTSKLSLIPIDDKSSDPKLSEPLYTIKKPKADALVFHFHQRNDEDVNFKGSLTSELSLSEREVVLTTWPEFETHETTPKTEVLLRNIDNLYFEFFDCEKHTWETTWLKKSKPLPSMIRITTSRNVSKKEEAEMAKTIQNQYVIFLPQAQKEIIYPEKPYESPSPN